MSAGNRTSTVSLAVFWLVGAVALAQTVAEADPGFDRIIPGWTNYSTAFNATHDSDVGGEFATVASFYTPAVEVQPREYRVVVVWFGAGGQRFDFGNFRYEVHVWHSLEAFVRDPRRGDVAVLKYELPTGGTGSPDTVTRGGRSAYVLQFDLAGASLTLTQCHSYLVGFVAQAQSIQAGELYVPTAPHDGLSDVQAGNIVAFGWTYLLNTGGQTIYSGQLATALSVQPSGEPLRLEARRSNADLCLSWPASGACYSVECSDDLSTPQRWSPVDAPPVVENGSNRLCIPAADAVRWYRLKKESDSHFESR